MCLAIPGKITAVFEGYGTVEFGSIGRKVDLRLLEDVREGDYVLVHAGFAIEKIDEEEALKTIALFADLSKPFEELE